MKIFTTVLLIFSIVHQATGRLDRKSSSICDEPVLEQYNANPASCSSNFLLTPSKATYQIDEPIEVKIQGATVNSTFIGVHLSAQNQENINVGSWKTTDSSLQSTTCGGVMHSSNDKKNSVDAVWYASSDVSGDVVIRAIIVENDDTIYVDCFKVVLIPRVFNNTFVTDGREPPPNTTTTISTTTTTTAESNSTTSTTTVSTSTATVTVTVSTTTTTVSTSATPSPTVAVSVNASWTFDAVNNITNMQMTMNNLQAMQWAALGLNLNDSMGGAHVFMCKRLANNSVVLHRYRNGPKHEGPDHVGPEDGGVLTLGQQQFQDGIVTCQFNLSDFPSTSTPTTLSQTTFYYPIFAVGLLDSNSEPQRHAKDSRMVQSDLVRLNETHVVLYKVKPQDDSSETYVRAHGIIMVITWIVLVSTGALISRYFKTSWTNKLICGKAAWFAAHRFLMTLAVILTVLAFLFILVALGGTWVENGPTRAFAHSITGILVICLAFFQPMIALFRCEPDSRYRYIFNYLHAFVGFSAFILSIATLFLATYFRLFTDNRARVIMILWIIWVVIIFVTFETVQRYFQKKNIGSAYTTINASSATIGELTENPMAPNVTLARVEVVPEDSQAQKIKTVLLALHFLVAAILAIIFAVLIGR